MAQSQSRAQLIESAITLYGAGQAAHARRHYQEAISLFTQSPAVWDQAGGCWLQIAGTCHALAPCYSNCFDFAASLATINRELAVLQNCRQHTDDSLLYLAATIMRRGSMLVTLGRPTETVVQLETAVAAYERADSAQRDDTAYSL